MTEKDVLKHFKLPVKFQPESGYIFDDDNQMIGEVRGWGYISGKFKKEAEAEEAQDKLGEMIATAFNEKYYKP